jgi:hypothetical protein
MPRNLTQLAASYPTAPKPNFAAAILAAGPDLYLRCNDGSGLTAVDVSGNGRNCVFGAGAAVFGSDAPPIGDATAGSVFLTAVGNGVVASVPTTGSQSSVTICGCFKASSGSQARCYLVSKNNESNPHAYAVSIRSSATIYVESSGGYAVFSVPSIFDGNWHFVLVTITQSAVTLDLDGTSLGSQSPIGLGGWEQASDLSIGSEGGTNWLAQFTLAEIAIFSYALTTRQKAALYAAIAA